jgi:hypothetical protein
MNQPMSFVLVATLAVLAGLPTVEAQDGTAVRVVSTDHSSGSGQHADVTARVGERVVVIGNEGQSEIEVIVRKLPPGKRAIVYVEVRPKQDGTDITIPKGLPLGCWFRLVNVNSGHCLSGRDDSLTPGTRLSQTETGGNDPAQLWRLIPASDDGWFALQNRASEQVMSLPDGRKNAGANLVQSPLDENNADQRWRPLWVKGDCFVVLNRRSSQALAVAYGAKHPGATICQWPLQLNGQQHQWRLEPVAE